MHELRVGDLYVDKRSGVVVVVTWYAAHQYVVRELDDGQLHAGHLSRFEQHYAPYAPPLRR